jgi:gas vesicle protein
MLDGESIPCRSNEMKNFLIGLGVGIAAGTMIAPARGEETREQLRGRAQDILHRVRGRADRAWQRAAMAGDVVRSVRGPRSERRERAGEREERDGSVTRLNSISREELLEVYGIGPVLADKIIQNRPYNRADEVVERGILPQSTFEKLREALGRRSA